MDIWGYYFGYISVGIYLISIYVDIWTVISLDGIPIEWYLWIEELTWSYHPRMIQHEVLNRQTLGLDLLEVRDWKFRNRDLIQPSKVQLKICVFQVAEWEILQPNGMGMRRQGEYDTKPKSNKDEPSDHESTPGVLGNLTSWLFACPVTGYIRMDMGKPFFWADPSEV